MNYASQATDYALPKSEPASDMISKRIGEMEDAVEAIQGHVNRFFGSIPLPAGAAPQPVSNGLHDEWNNRLRGLVAHLRDLAGRMN